MKDMVKFLSVAVFSIAIMAVASCTSTPAVTITDDDKGKSIVVPEGKLFAVKLKAQLGTGYSWQMKGTSDLVSQKSSPVQESSDKKETGGFDYQIFSFKALKKGKSDLMFQYRQPWNTKAKALKEYKVTVEIQ